MPDGESVTYSEFDRQTEVCDKRFEKIDKNTEKIQKRLYRVEIVSWITLAVLVILGLTANGTMSALLKLILSIA